MAKQNNNNKGRHYDETKDKFRNSKSKKRRSSSSRGNDRDYDSERPNSSYNSPEQRGSANDPAWWMKTGQLAKDTSTIPTFAAAGAKQRSPLVQDNYYTPAGIMRYDYVPYFGILQNPTDPLNLAAKVLYDTVNSKNSRNPSYDPSDLMTYVIGVANAWVVYQWIARLVGMYNTFSVLNRYWWVPIAQSMGVAAISTNEDIVTWRNLANRIALKLNMLPVPASISYFDRAMQMVTAVYADSPTLKASLYYFSPASLMKYQYDTEGKGELVWTQCPWYGVNPSGDLVLPSVTPATVESWFDSFTENLFNDSDISTIGSDIIKAYGAENCFRLPQVTEAYKIAYEYVPGINLQLHNARLATNAMAPTGSKITQDMTKNCLVFNNPGPFGNTSPHAALRYVDENKGVIPLDFPTDNPSNEDVIEATRLTYYCKDGKYYACTELLVNNSAFTFTQVDSANPEDWSLNMLPNVVMLGTSVTGANAEISAVGKKLNAYTKFHDAPIGYFVHANSTGDGLYYPPKDMYFTCDFTNYTTISVEDLRELHDVCTLSIFSPLAFQK